MNPESVGFPSLCYLDSHRGTCTEDTVKAAPARRPQVSRVLPEAPSPVPAGVEPGGRSPGLSSESTGVTHRRRTECISEKVQSPPELRLSPLGQRPSMLWGLSDMKRSAESP